MTEKIITTDEDKVVESSAEPVEETEKPTHPFTLFTEEAFAIVKKYNHFPTNRMNDPYLEDTINRVAESATNEEKEIVRQSVQATIDRLRGTVGIGVVDVTAQRLKDYLPLLETLIEKLK